MTKKILQLEVSFYQTGDFKELQKIWYGKLKADGFEDAEKKVGDDMVLCQNASYGHNHKAATEFREEYYRVLSQCINDELFESELDRIILCRIAEGFKIAEISNELKQLGQRWHRQTIRFRIRKYENKLGIRSWEEEKLNPAWKNGKKRVPIAS